MLLHYIPCEFADIEHRLNMSFVISVLISLTIFWLRFFSEHIFLISWCKYCWLSLLAFDANAITVASTVFNKTSALKKQPKTTASGWAANRGNSTAETLVVELEIFL